MWVCVCYGYSEHYVRVTDTIGFLGIPKYTACPASVPVPDLANSDCEIVEMHLILRELGIARLAQKTGFTALAF